MPALFPFLLGLVLLAACTAKMPAQVDPMPASKPEALRVGAERMAEYLPLLKDKRVAVITNQTGRVGRAHLVDTLVNLGVRITKVFAPEHGFRGDADAGEHVKDGRDARTGLPLVSLYGENKRPKPEQLQDVDVLLFDIQDVGVRFYTYIGTLHYVMEAAADAKLPVVVLDRPNPNGFYVDGPVLDPAHRSFVGMHPVPLVHGMTVGEFARMIVGEGWLGAGRALDLTVVPCSGYDHRMAYAPPVRPSPNLPNLSAVMLYPALGLFEGTVVSVGRGTDAPFQCIGFPGCTLGAYRFTPRPMPGAKDPPYNGRECTGLDLAEYGTFYSRLDPRLHLGWLIGMYQAAVDKDGFFTPFFDKLAGGPDLRERIRRGESEELIRVSWKPALEAFRTVRVRYLLYPEGP